MRDPSLQKREGQALSPREVMLGPPGREDREVMLTSSSQLPPGASSPQDPARRPPISRAFCSPKWKGGSQASHTDLLGSTPGKPKLGRQGPEHKEDREGFVAEVMSWVLKD